MGASYTYPMDDKWASLGFPARVCGLLGIRIDGAASLLMVPVFSCYPGTYIGCTGIWASTYRH